MSHYTVCLMASEPGLKRPASSPASKEDKKLKDQCLACQEPENDDVFECAWCEGRQHSQCTKISSEQCEVLNNVVSNIAFSAQPVLSSYPMLFKAMTTKALLTPD